jgi:exonuclease-1
MGIAGLLPNLRSVQRAAHVREYSGKVVAVDGYCWLHRGAFSCSRELCEGRPTRRCVNSLGSRSHRSRLQGLKRSGGGYAGTWTTA